MHEAEPPGDHAIEISLGEADDFGSRLDRLLTRELARLGHELSRSQLARSFEQKSVQIDGQPVKASYRLDKMIKVEVRLPKAPPLARAFPEDLPLNILHEDESVLVVDKAAGMVVHAGAGHERGTLVNAVLHHLQIEARELPLLEGNGPERPGVVHRLDKDTSGVMILAKTAKAQTHLAEQFRSHRIGRQYLAICRGKVDFSRKRVLSQHGRDSQDRRRFAPKGPREAISNFYRVCAGRSASVLACRLETGRTHQIRMHARALGYPLLADALYAGRCKDPILAPIEATLARQALHAQILAFEHPTQETELSFSAPLPPDLRQALSDLGLDLRDLSKLDRIRAG